MIVSIHQPLYLPWQPYFGKIACSDFFIFLDDVQYPQGKGFFNRNIIRGVNGPIVLTAPVTGRSDRPLVKDIRLVSSSEWQSSHWRSITLNYAKSPFFAAYSSAFEDIYLKNKWEYLSDLNYALICKVAELLKFKTRFFWASKIPTEHNTGTNRLIELVSHVEGGKYLSGSGEGSMRYMDVQQYSQAGIQVLSHTYVQIPYRQRWREFLPDTSILDLIFNCGPQSTEIISNCSTILPV